MTSDSLAVGATHHVHQLGDLATLLDLVARGDRAFDAVGDVIAQDFLLGAAQRRTHGRDLRDDVDAVAVLLDHLREATNLALDPAETFSDGCLDVLAHEIYIPLPGIGYKAGVQE